MTSVEGKEDMVTVNMLTVIEILRAEVHLLLPYNFV